MFLQMHVDVIQAIQVPNVNYSLAMRSYLLILQYALVEAVALNLMFATVKQDMVVLIVNCSLVMEFHQIPQLLAVVEGHVLMLINARADQATVVLFVKMYMTFIHASVKAHQIHKYAQAKVLVLTIIFVLVHQVSSEVHAKM